jgi:hypothetical protein
VNNNGEEYCTCPNGYNLTMKNNITGICESKYILIYNLTMTDNVVQQYGGVKPVNGIPPFLIIGSPKSIHM